MTVFGHRFPPRPSFRASPMYTRVLPRLLRIRRAFISSRRYTSIIIIIINISIEFAYIVYPYRHYNIITVFRLSVAPTAVIILLLHTRFTPYEINIGWRWWQIRGECVPLSYYTHLEHCIVVFTRVLILLAVGGHMTNEMVCGGFAIIIFHRYTSKTTAAAAAPNGYSPVLCKICI